MMACEPALMDQDVWLNDFLSSLPTIELDGETLTLASGDTTMILDELQPSELVDTTWTVTGTVANEAHQQRSGGLDGDNRDRSTTRCR